MSDFLKQFSDEGHGPSADNSIEKEVSIPAVSTESSLRKSAQKIAGTEHVVKKDKTYDRKKIVRYASIALSVLAVSILALGVYFISNQVQVRDFVGVDISEARTWGIQNRITIDAVEVYSIEYDSDTVISQSKEAGSRVTRGSVISLEVSKGPDMTEALELPDFAAMTTAEVRVWRQEVAALNANVNEEYHESIDAGAHIRYEFTDPTVNRQNYTRADGLLIFMSRGRQVFEANIPVPDFTNRPLQEVQDWACEHNLELEYVEIAHDSIDAGMVADQSKGPDARIAREDSFSVTVSLGPAITVPNFANISFEDAASVRGLEVTVERRYQSRLAFGRLVSQSIAAGTELTGDGHHIRVVYSRGRPYMENLIGESESVLAERFYAFTSNGANISYTLRYIDHYQPRGTIVGMSQYATFLSLREHIRIDVSRGNRTAPAEADAHLGFEQE